MGWRFCGRGSCSTAARWLRGCGAEPRRSGLGARWQPDALSAEENERGYLMNKTHLRPIADANAGCAAELSLTSGCLMLSVVQPRLKAYQQIVRCFGTGILLESGEINREALGNIIFSHPEKRQLLNAITHPEIQKEMLKQILKYFVLGKRPGRAAAGPARSGFGVQVGRGMGKEKGAALRDGRCALPPAAFSAGAWRIRSCPSCLSLLPFASFFCGVKCIWRA